MEVHFPFVWAVLENSGILTHKMLDRKIILIKKEINGKL